MPMTGYWRERRGLTGKALYLIIFIAALVAMLAAIIDPERFFVGGFAVAVFLLFGVFAHLPD